jgi:hypothetical protein
MVLCVRPFSASHNTPHPSENSSSATSHDITSSPQQHQQQHLSSRPHRRDSTARIQRCCSYSSCDRALLRLRLRQAFRAQGPRRWACPPPASTVANHTQHRHRHRRIDLRRRREVYPPHQHHQLQLQHPSQAHRPDDAAPCPIFLHHHHHQSAAQISTPPAQGYPVTPSLHRPYSHSQSRSQYPSHSPLHRPPYPSCYSGWCAHPTCPHLRHLHLRRRGVKPYSAVGLSPGSVGTAPAIHPT